MSTSQGYCEDLVNKSFCAGFKVPHERKYNTVRKTDTVFGAGDRGVGETDLGPLSWSLMR